MDVTDISELRDATSGAVDEWGAAVENGERYLEIIEADR